MSDENNLNSNQNTELFGFFRGKATTINFIENDLPVIAEKRSDTNFTDSVVPVFQPAVFGLYEISFLPAHDD